MIKIENKKYPVIHHILDNCIENKCKDCIDKLHQKLISLESNMQKKAESTEVQQLQKRMEECEKRISRLPVNNKQERQNMVSVEYWVQQTLVELHWTCCNGFE